MTSHPDSEQSRIELREVRATDQAIRPHSDRQEAKETAQ